MMRAHAASRIGPVRSVAAGVVMLVLGSALPAQSQVLPSRLLRYAAVVDGAAESSVRWPVAVAAGPVDEVAVADAWKNRLLVFRRVGASWTIASETALPATPVALAHVGGQYLVALRGVSRLLALGEGEKGVAPREMALPEGILPGRLANSSDGALLVWDSRRGRVVKLREGAIVAQVAIERTVTALASDGAGGFWAATGETGEVHRYDGAGKAGVTWRLPADGPVPAWPAGIVSDPKGRLFVLDRHSHRVVVLDAEGRAIGIGSGKGHEPGQLMFPGGLARLPGGGLLVGDSGNGRAQLFEVVGGGTG